jgi:hypothetical protein
MKKIHLILSLVLFTSIAFGQTMVEKTAKVNSQKTVVLDFDFADQITIKGWDNDEVLVKASVNINENINNDSFKLEVKEMSSTLSFISEIEDMKKISKNRVTVTTSKDGKRRTTYSDGWHIDMDIYFEVFLPKNIEIDLRTISGDIILTNVGGVMNLETISGFIDVQINKNAKATVKTSSISGGVYTDHEIQFKRILKNEKYHLISGRSPHFNLNGGGRSIRLETISGNIYIRK